MTHPTFDVILTVGGWVGGCVRPPRAVRAARGCPRQLARAHPPTPIRRAYTEHPAYLVRRAFERRHDLEQRTEPSLLTRVPLPRHRPAGRRSGHRCLSWPGPAQAGLAVDRLDPASPCSSGFGLAEGVLERVGCALRSASVGNRRRGRGRATRRDEAATGGHRTGRSGSWAHPEGGLPGQSGPDGGRLAVAEPSHGTRLRVMRQTMLWFDAAFRRDRFPSSSPRCPAGRSTGFRSSTAVGQGGPALRGPGTAIPGRSRARDPAGRRTTGPPVPGRVPAGVNGRGSPRRTPGARRPRAPVGGSAASGVGVLIRD